MKLRFLFSRLYWQSVLILVQISVSKQHKNTILGNVWGLCQPFVHIAVISFFVGFLLRVEAKIMVKNLVGALPFWTYLVSSLNLAANSLITRENILKRLAISKTLFPVADCLSQAYTMLLSFCAMYFALIVFYNDAFSFKIIFIPFFALPLIISCITCSIASAFLTVYIRDIPFLITLLFNVAYWSVPIVYPYSFVPADKQFLYEFNPLFLLLRPIQMIVTDATLPSLLLVIKSWIICGMAVLISFCIYKKLQRQVVYYL